MAIKRGFIRHIGAGNNPIRSGVLTNVSTICYKSRLTCVILFLLLTLAWLPPCPCLVCNYVLQLNFLPLRIIARRHQHKLILIKIFDFSIFN